jgi:hypothetical protein
MPSNIILPRDICRENFSVQVQWLDEVEGKGATPEQETMINEYTQQKSAFGSSPQAGAKKEERRKKTTLPRSLAPSLPRSHPVSPT